MSSHDIFPSTHKHDHQQPSNAVKKDQPAQHQPRITQDISPTSTSRPDIKTSISSSGIQKVLNTSQEIPTVFRPLRLTTVPFEQKTSSGNPRTEPPFALQTGLFLHQERYILTQAIEQQRWSGGLIETRWLAQDIFYGRRPVILYEVFLPQWGMMAEQSFVRQATIALTSIGRHRSTPTLWDVFSEHNRHFFVFEPANGEILEQRMMRLQKPLSEQEVLEMCLQITEILEIVNAQAPRFIHGRITPAHIVIRSNLKSYMLTDFSLILAGQAATYMQEPLRPEPSQYPFSFAAHSNDIRVDLYALLASAYMLLTGTERSAVQPSPHVRERNPLISTAMDAIIAKGLPSTLEQGYQSIEALRKDLQVVYDSREHLVQSSGTLARLQRLQVARPTSQMSASFAGPAFEAKQEIRTTPRSNNLVAPAERKVSIPENNQSSDEPQDLMRQILEPEIKQMSIPRRREYQFLLYWLLGVGLLALLLATAYILFSNR